MEFLLPPPSFAAAAAKSLQSCLTLCDPMDCSLPGSSVPGILQARTLEWVALFFSSACMHAKSCQSCLTARPYGQQPTRILCPQDSLGKITGVGCRFLLHTPALLRYKWHIVLCKFKVYNLMIIYSKMTSTIRLGNITIGLPWWLSGKEWACQYRQCGFNPWVAKILWRRKRQPL